MQIVNFRSLIKSFRYAGKGIKYAFKNEQNFRIHVATAAVVTALMLVLPVEAWKRLLLTLVMFLVLILELINSTFEKMTDILKPRIHHYAEIIKDLMAAVVLLASLCALLIGLYVFIPYLLWL